MRFQTHLFRYSDFVYCVQKTSPENPVLHVGGFSQCRFQSGAQYAHNGAERIPVVSAVNIAAITITSDEDEEDDDDDVNIIIMTILEGTLSKWTNVMKGWQYRWFVLDENAGLLSYYTVSVRGTRNQFVSACVRERVCVYFHASRRVIFVDRPDVLSFANVCVGFCLFQS